jgi:hypothetical protein
MGRRWGGLLIIMLVVVAAIAIPSAGGRQVSGTARPAPIPGPPAVGACLARPETDDALQSPNLDYRPQTFGPCGKRVFGEVAAVIGDHRSHEPAQPTMQTPDDGSTLTDDPNQLPCLDASNRYLGLTVGEDHMPMIVSDWRPSSLMSVSLSGPNLTQRAAGQRWVACTVSLHDWDGNAASYQGTLEGAFALGTLPPALALCLDTANLASAEPESCDKPHHVEVFGVADTARPGLTQRALDGSCLALAERMTGMSDPSAQGQLQVRAATVHGETGTPVVGLGTATDESGYAACMAVTPETHQLQRTLLALRNKPLPWSAR